MINASVASITIIVFVQNVDPQTWERRRLLCFHIHERLYIWLRMSQDSHQSKGDSSSAKRSTKWPTTKEGAFRTKREGIRIAFLRSGNKVNAMLLDATRHGKWNFWEVHESTSGGLRSSNTRTSTRNWSRSWWLVSQKQPFIVGNFSYFGAFSLAFVKGFPTPRDLDHAVEMSFCSRIYVKHLEFQLDYYSLNLDQILLIVFDNYLIKQKEMLLSTPSQPM